MRARSRPLAFCGTRCLCVGEAPPSVLHAVRHPQLDPATHFFRPTHRRQSPTLSPTPVGPARPRYSPPHAGGRGGSPERGTPHPRRRPCSASSEPARSRQSPKKMPSWGLGSRTSELPEASGRSVSAVSGPRRSRNASNVSLQSSRRRAMPARPGFTNDVAHRRDHILRGEQRLQGGEESMGDCLRCVGRKKCVAG